MTRSTNEKLLLSVPEAAALLGLTSRRLYAHIAEHRLPEEIVVRLGRSVRLSRPRLLQWLGAADDAGVHPPDSDA